MAYQTHSAVLFLLFNRPQLTRKVFEAIRQAAPPRLYIAADGPRPEKTADEELCTEARQTIKQIDWPCEVKTLFRVQNLGCKEAVSSAISWFFEHEEEGIILEDDCLPANDFFRFCDTMLEHYRHDTRIRHIGGSNLQGGKRWGNASYYFSNLTHAWGWATWHRVWQSYDKNLSAYDEQDVAAHLGKIFSEPIIVDSWLKVFRQVKSGTLNTWDYQLTFINLFNNSLSVIPNVNLVSNIGFGPDATHTIDAGNRYENLPAGALGEITHPLYILAEKDADYVTLSHDFEVSRLKKKQRRLDRRIRRWWRGSRKG